MSHNSHYVIIKAKDIDYANGTVENELDNFGNENNWYSIIRTVNLNNLSDEDKEYLNGELKEFNEYVSKEKYNTILEHIEKLQQQLNSGNRFILYELSQCYKNLYELQPYINREPITIETLKNVDDYFSYQFDEYGITNMENWDIEDEYDFPTFFIEVDVHS